MILLDHFVLYFPPMPIEMTPQAKTETRAIRHKSNKNQPILKTYLSVKSILRLLHAAVKVFFNKQAR